MNPEEFSKDLKETLHYSLEALPYIGQKARREGITNPYYARWVEELLTHQIEALKYLRLKARLKQFWGEEWHEESSR